MTSLKAARAAVAVQITTATADYAPAVLPFDPPTITGDTITVSTAGASPTEWLLSIRIYVNAIQSAEGQDRVDDLLTACESVAETSALTPRGDWDLAFDESKEAFVMTTTVGYPRDDF